MTKRFADNVDIDSLLASKYSKKTDYMNLYAERLLDCFTKERNLTVDYKSAESVDSLLRQFYGSVRKEDGASFTLTTFISLRYSIARVLKKNHQWDIVKDAQFTRSNEVFEAMKMT